MLCDAAVVRAAASGRCSRARCCGEALAFGLPRVPHGVAQQVMAVGDGSS